MNKIHDLDDISVSPRIIEAWLAHLESTSAHLMWKHPDLKNGGACRRMGKEMKVTVQYSAGRGKNGKSYAYIRPAGKCHNKSRRVSADPDMVLDAIERHFPEVHYYRVKGLVIGAKSPESALREFWRICEHKDIGEQFPVENIEE